MVGRTVLYHRSSRLSTIQNADIILVMVDGDIVNMVIIRAARGVYYQMQTGAGVEGNLLKVD